MNFDVVEWLDEQEPKYINWLVDTLNNKGIVLDETAKWTRVFFRKWDDECTKFLTDRDLECESLCTTAHECPHRGWIYALFDCNKYEYSEVRDYIDEYCKKSKDVDFNLENT